MVSQRQFLHDLVDRIPQDQLDQAAEALQEIISAGEWSNERSRELTHRTDVDQDEHLREEC
jgi:hypothetical protein